MKKYYLMNKDNIVASACMEQGTLGENLQIEKVSGTLPIGLTQILVRARIKIALAQGRNVIFDSTNTKKEIRMSYLAAAKEMKTGSCRLDLCLIPLAQHSPFVQTEICSSLYQNLQDNYPDMKEGWDIIEEINKKDRTNEIQQGGPDVRKESFALDQAEL